MGVACATFFEQLAGVFAGCVAFIVEVQAPQLANTPMGLLHLLGELGLAIRRELKYLLDETEHPVRHIPERKVDPCACGHDRSCVGECLKAVLVVVSAHS